MRVGYLEAWAGTPLDPDRYPEPSTQATYECGRLHALNLRVAGATMPRWPADTRMPRALVAATQAAIATIGQPTPTLARRA